jgi:two-component system OmpR family sensor kinase
MIVRWLPILAPALLGLILAVWYNQSDLANPTLVLRAQMSALIALSGIGLSALAAIGLILADWVERRHIRILLEAAEERRRFLSRLDHELKNPLTAIFAGLANLSSDVPDEERRASTASIEAQMKRLRGLVSDLRKLADLETRKLERAPVDLSELLRDNYELLQERFESASRQINLSIPQAPWPLPEVSGDRDLLFLAIHNLLDNALKYTGEGDTIELRAYEDGSNVVVEVADTGPGIPEGEQAYVWNELYRGTGARGISGSGLGLALVRSIVQRHGGKVTLRSRRGQGTVFAIHLPAGDVTRR